MLDMTNSTTEGRTDVTFKKPWEDPIITLERGLEVSAQGVPPSNSGPGGPPRGFLGPLSVSGGVCL